MSLPCEFFCLAHTRLTASPSAADIANSADGKSIAPVFGNLFLYEPVPHGGSIDVSDAPGFGLELNPACTLLPSSHFLAPNPEVGLSHTEEEVLVQKAAQKLARINGSAKMNGVTH